MTEKRFTIAYEKGNWWAVRDGDITLWKEEVVGLLNEQNETIQRLEAQLSHLEYRFTEYRNKVGKND